MARTCPHCGAKLPDVWDTFCSACGAELDPTPQAHEPQPAPQPAHEPPASTQAPAASAPTAFGGGDEQAARFWLTLFELTPRVYVTRALVALNVIVFVVMVASGVSATNPTPQVLVRWGALFGPLTLDGEWWRLLTCTFLHIGVIHLLLNMWVLATGGPIVERMVGNVGFLLLYLISGLGGSLAALLWSPNVVAAGASGAVFGVFGALLGVLRKQRGSIPGAALAGLKNFGVSFLLVNLLFGFSVPNISMSAHAGGAATGFLCGLVLSQPFTPEGAAARARQNVLTGVMGAVAVVLGALLVSTFRTNEAEVDRDLERVAAVEQRVLDTYNAATARADRGEITELELAAIVERDVLPEWRSAIGRLAAHAQVPGPLGKHLAAVIGYMRLRQEGWELFVQAVREQSTAKGERSRDKHRLADEALKQLVLARRAEQGR